MSNSNINILPINADRICEAISKIGYNPSSAIMDVIDNSFMAMASEIVVKIFLKEGMNVNNTKNIDKIIIVDNGKGMNDDGIKKALELGSEVQYGDNSLSKYGLGLKSAGFSLGRRIEVLSKVEKESVSEKFYLDRDLIRDSGIFGYAIEKGDILQESYLKDYNSGTVITFLDLIYTSRVSASKISEDLANKAGVNYCEFLKKQNVSFKIQIFNTDGSEVLKEKTVIPKDILFWEEAYENFKKESYDCKKPSKVLDDFFDNPLNPTGQKIKIQASIFPKDGMKSYPLFSDIEQKKIKEYDVSLKNSGFYFYRNGRLIKWGEKLFLSRDFGLRIKISFNTEHDDLFDVDVSKQHLTVSEDVEAILKSLITIPRQQSKELFEVCDILVKSSKNNGNEGSEFNVTNSTLEEEEDETSQISALEVNKRKAILEENSKKLDEETKPKYENEDENETFRRVRYWMGARNLWETGIDRVEGSYVLINNSHPFYDLVLNNLEKGSPARQSIEALFHALAVGQNQTIQKYGDVDGDIVMEIFKKFSRSTSHQLDSWVNNNWNLFDNDN